MQTERLDEGLFRTTAPSGLVVLSERMPTLRSAALGMWVRSASAHEPRPKMGVSHLLEHMVFKGTERRSARQIALELEVRGGSLDAFTSRDHTSYQAHVLDDDLPLAADILTDLIRRPLLRASDLDPERKVVIEEIGGVEDTPDDLVFDLHAETLWGEHPYGYSILGSRESVGALEARDLRAVHEEGYYAGNCVIAAAGNLEHDALLATLDREGWFDDEEARPARAAVRRAPARHGTERSETRDTTQCHIVFGTDTFQLNDPRRFALAILANAFGGGMSSRLFQRIREELGLAYSIFAFKHFFQSAGQLGVYIGTRPEAADQAVEAIRAEYDLIARGGLPDGELEDGKRQFKGQIMLSLENPNSRMSRLAANELHDDPYRPLGRLLADIDAVTPDQVRAVGAEFFPAARQTVLRLGPDGA